MNSNGYIYITEDLAERDDFFKSKRFQSYKNQINKKIRFKKNEVILVLKNRKNFYYKPIVDLQTLVNQYGKNFNNRNNSFTADYQLTKNNIKFAFIGLDSDSSLLERLIQNKIPFALVSPHNKKCEWFVLNGERACPYSPCVLCNDYINQPCQDHDAIYCSVDSKKYLDLFLCRLKNILEKEHEDLDAIPIFEYSTAIDIVRWFVFNQEISTIVLEKNFDHEKKSYDDSSFKEYQERSIIEKLGNFISTSLKDNREFK